MEYHTIPHLLSEQVNVFCTSYTDKKKILNHWALKCKYTHILLLQSYINSHTTTTRTHKNTLN